MGGESWHRWLVKIITRGPGMHAAVPQVEDVLILDLGPPPDHADPSADGSVWSAGMVRKQPRGRDPVVARDDLIEYELPILGLDFEFGRCRIVLEGDRWVAR